MAIYPPITTSDYTLDEKIRDREAKRQAIEGWVTTQLPNVETRVEKLELEIKAVMEAVTDATEKLETLLSAIREEVSVIAAHAPKTLAAAGRIAMEDIKDEQP